MLASPSYMLDTLLFSPAGAPLPAIAAGGMGLLIGSLLNVVIHRLPKMMQREFDNYIASESGLPLPHQDHYNLAIPRSACPQCGHRLGACENIPLISYALLRGKCKNCRQAISWRYPSVEFLTALLSAWIIWHFGSGAIGMAALIFVWLLIAMSVIDMETQLLPDTLTLSLLWLGLLFNLNGLFVPLQEAVIGAVAGYLGLWSVARLFRLVTGKDGMGLGDVKLLAALGAWLGWKMLPLIILLSSATGVAAGIGLLMLTQHKRHHPIAFGPFLATAGLLALLFGPALTHFYFSLL